MGRPPPPKKPRRQKGGGVDDDDHALSAAFDAINKSNGSSGPVVAAAKDPIAYAEKAVTKPPRNKPDKPDKPAWSPPPARQLDPVLRGSKDYPQVAKGDNLVSKLDDDLKKMVRSIRDVVQKTIGNIDSSKKVSEVNDSLVNFANDSMTIIIKLSDTFFSVISHMKELNKELDTLNRQIANNPIATQVGSLDARIRNNMKELRKQFEDSVRKISSYAGPEVSNIVNRAIQSMQDAIERSGDLYKVVQSAQAMPQQGPQQPWGRQQQQQW